MNKKDIITFEMAKKAKLAGFKKETYHFYKLDGTLDKIYVRLNFNISDNYYSATTYEDYLKWINTKDNDNSRNRSSSRAFRRLFF